MVSEKEREETTMTIYEQNYNNRLDEMLNQIIQNYGLEHPRTIAFAGYVEKYKGKANYQNRDKMEKIFKGWMK